MPMGQPDFRIVGRPYHGEHNEVAIRMVSAGYMTTLRTTLVSGRYFADADNASGAKVVIVNQALARQYFPGENPVGKVRFYRRRSATPMLIVGLINDIQEGQLGCRPARRDVPSLRSRIQTAASSFLCARAQDERADAARSRIRHCDPSIPAWPSTIP